MCAEKVDLCSRFHCGVNKLVVMKRAVLFGYVTFLFNNCLTIAAQVTKIIIIILHIIGRGEKKLALEVSKY